MFADHVAMIRGVDDQRVVQQVVLLQRGQDLPDHRIDPRHHAPVGGPCPQHFLLGNLFNLGMASPPAQMRMRLIGKRTRLARQGHRLSE